MRSRRRGARRGRGRLAAAALVLAVAGGAAVAVSSGLVVIGRPAGGAPAAGQDTSAGAVVLPPPPAVAMAPADSLGRDSLARDSLGRDSFDLDSIVPDSTPVDSGAVERRAPGAPAATATAAELATLASRMIVPVSGVRPDQLVDSFDDARGAGGAQSGEGTRRHDALDILAPRGTPVVAATGGRVLKLFDSRRGGLTVYTTDENERFVLLYGHLDRYAPTLREGARVRQGETIGYVGTTGNANPATPHLHFAVARTDDPARWYGGTPVNPYPLLRKR